MGYLGNVRPTIALVAADIADGAVTTAKIAADAVTAAKIGADQIGSSELNLGANYAFTGTVTGTTQGLKLLATATASNSATLDFSSTYITSTYDSYMLLGEQLIPATDVTEPLLKFSHDNGSNLHGSGIESGRLYISVSQSGSAHEYNANQAYMQLATYSLIIIPDRINPL